MAQVGLSLYMDSSGTYPELTIPALASLQTHKSNAVYKKLRNDFFEGRALKKKGSDLNEKKLFQMMEILNELGVRAYVIAFKNKNWVDYKQKYSSRANFKEKIMACLHTRLLRDVCRRNYHYQVNVCPETWMKSERFFSYLTDLT